MVKNSPLILLILITLLILSACGVKVTPSQPAPATQIPTQVSLPTERVPTDTQPPIPTDTALTESTETSSPTATDETQSQVTAVSFVKDILPLFNQRCTACHGGRAGLYLDSYAAVMAGSSDGVVIIPGNPDASLLAQLVQSGQMPRSGGKLTPAQIQMIIDWIMAGALNN